MMNERLSRGLSTKSVAYILNRPGFRGG